MGRYTFDDPAARQRERELAAARVQVERVRGDYSADTYKDRLAASRGPVTTPEERKAAHDFNERYKRHKAGKCGRRCYWCGTLIDKRTKTKEPESETFTLRPDTSRNAVFR